MNDPVQQALRAIHRDPSRITYHHGRDCWGNRLHRDDRQEITVPVYAREHIPEIHATFDYDGWRYFLTHTEWRTDHQTMVCTGSWSALGYPLLKDDA